MSLLLPVVWPPALLILRFLSLKNLLLLQFHPLWPCEHPLIFLLRCYSVYVFQSICYLFGLLGLASFHCEGVSGSAELLLLHELGLDHLLSLDLTNI